MVQKIWFTGEPKLALITHHTSRSGYQTGGRSRDYAAFISRSGVVDQTYPKYGNGVRPVCTLSLETPVVQGDDGFYYIKPFEVESNAFTDNELFALLGMA